MIVELQIVASSAAMSALGTVAMISSWIAGVGFGQAVADELAATFRWIGRLSLGALSVLGLAAGTVISLAFVIGLAWSGAGV